MALVSIRTKSQLGKSYVLAPERYDPRRGVLLDRPSTVSLGEVVQLVRKTVNAGGGTQGRYLVLDTSDAQEGLIICRKEPIQRSEIGSTKKVVEAGDVIVSRLRPYLRQVAYVDRAIRNWYEDVQLACSTEFYILRSRDSRPVAYLVPFLLSTPVQKVLAASQEGGHHPRFGEESLLSLPVPQSLLNESDAISEEVIKSVELYRESESKLFNMIKKSHDEFVGMVS